MVLEYIQRLLLTAPPILLALTMHECAHALTASRLGDPTARMLGRVSLNPLRHLDPIGTAALFLSGMFGWAKPVPVNARNFRDPGRSLMLVALAGPLSNLMLAGVSAIAFKVLSTWGDGFLAAYPAVFRPIFIMVELSIVMNVSLAIFNLVPIPPLDGSRVLSYLLPPKKAFAFSRFEPYGFVILVVLMFTGILGRVISPLVFLMTGLLTGGIL